MYFPSWLVCLFVKVGPRETWLSKNQYEKARRDERDELFCACAHRVAVPFAAVPQSHAQNSKKLKKIKEEQDNYSYHFIHKRHRHFFHLD